MPIRAFSAGSSVRRVVAEDGDLAGRALAEPLEDLGRGGLARAVGAEEREDLAALDVRGRCPGRPRASP